MKQIINITLGGRTIAIEEAAYEKVLAYTQSLRDYFKNEEGRDEIVADIEARFAELMQDKIRKGAPHITPADVDEMMATMGRPEDFAAQDSAGAEGYNPNFTINEKRRLYRDANNKMLGGVCSGIANWLNIDPTVVRVLFAIVSFGGFGTGILIYIALWIFLPARNIEVYKGKRMFRDPENKWFGGVAGGMSAYFNINANTIRGIMAFPLIISIIKGVDLFGGHSFGFFPNLIFNGLTGTFIFIYIVLWIVLPEALTPYQKMEMRGEQIDVNTIKQNVQSSLNDMNQRLKSWGQEVQESAENIGKKASEWGKSQSGSFERKFHYVPPKQNRGIGYVFAMIFKAIFVVIGGIIAVSLLAVFLTVLFSGFAFAPLNNFLWTSETQQMLGWATLILFIGAPIVGLVIWLVRRILSVRTPGNYLNWTFGGLWAIGWVCLMFFLASISADFKRYESVEDQVALQQPSNGKLLIRVSEPELFYEGNFGWMKESDNDLDGFNITEDTLSISHVQLDFTKSEDSLYHVTVVKQSMGKTDAEALARAQKINYTVSAVDSILDLPAGFTIDKTSKYRAQNVLVLIAVPTGRKINIDETVYKKLSTIDIAFNNGGRRVRSSRHITHRLRTYRSNTDYTMQSDGSLKSDEDLENQTSTTTEANGSTYRWEDDSTSSTPAAPPAPPAPPAPGTTIQTDSAVYRFNESPSQSDSKKQIMEELEKKQREIDALKKRLEQ
ncbi:PspC domain-containing protein [Niabella insulamsoli]|uniref:PspC domain-containing protein n=1 Tax=Niabella insulamsoli TaxID=3144874 RepID=UPI0031FD7901